MQRGAQVRRGEALDGQRSIEYAMGLVQPGTGTGEGIERVNRNGVEFEGPLSLGEGSDRAANAAQKCRIPKVGRNMSRSENDSLLEKTVGSAPIPVEVKTGAGKCGMTGGPAAIKGERRLGTGAGFEQGLATGKRFDQGTAFGEGVEGNRVGRIAPDGLAEVVARLPMFIGGGGKASGRTRRGAMVAGRRRAALTIGNKAIAAPGYGFHKARRLRSITQGLTQAHHGVVQAVFKIQTFYPGPQAPAQLVAGHNLTGSFQKREKQLERLLVKSNAGAVAVQPAGASVQFKIGKHETGLDGSAGQAFS